ncbi:helix-turn-helix transcriptional regulator [Nocardia nova]|nr:helix-turn-helix transcriptional regulator [Nocardia nova]
MAREIRSWRGLSLEAAAGLAGISYGYLGKLERGRRRPRSFGGMPLSSYFCPTPMVTTLRPAARSCSKTVDMRGDREAPLRSRASRYHGSGCPVPAVLGQADEPGLVSAKQHLSTSRRRPIQRRAGAVALR